MKTANKPKRNYARWIILIVAVLLCALYFFVPPVQEFVGHAASVLASADVDSVVEYIRSFGAYTMIFSFCLMVFQSVMAPLPAFLITFANAAIFGWWQGAILSWTSSMAGAVLCFYIARGLGRDVVERFAGQLLQARGRPQDDVGIIRCFLRRGLLDILGAPFDFDHFILQHMP